MDRITKEETRLLLQHVKANADFPKMVYLLLYHEEMVANHFAEPSLSGKEFLEKIVQLPFDIPAISQSRVQQVLFAGLDKPQYARSYPISAAAPDFWTAG